MSSDLARPWYLSKASTFPKSDEERSCFVHKARLSGAAAAWLSSSSLITFRVCGTNTKNKTKNILSDKSREVLQITKLAV